MARLLTMVVRNPRRERVCRRVSRDSIFGNAKRSSVPQVVFQYGSSVDQLLE